MVTGCMCGDVSCRAAEMGANVTPKKKKNIVLRPPPQTRHDPPTQQTSSPHSLWVYMCVCVQAQSAGWGYSKCMLSSPTDSHDELRAKKSVWLCLRVCVCVCTAVDWNCSLSRERAQQNGSAAAGPGRGRGEVGTRRKWIQWFEWETCVGEPSDSNVGYEEMKTSDYTLWYKQSHTALKVYFSNRAMSVPSPGVEERLQYHVQ